MDMTEYESDEEYEELLNEQFLYDLENSSVEEALEKHFKR
jgi:hypothetical protein